MRLEKNVAFRLTPQFIVDAVKIAQRGGFVPEGLHNLLPFNQLVDERRLLPAHTRLLGEVVVRLSGDEGRDEHRQRRQHHDQQGNHPVFDEHDGRRRCPHRQSCG